jgi:quinol monooxygenase YgiN
MITILFGMTVKAEQDAEWGELVSQLTRSTRSEDEGCVNYVFLPTARQSARVRSL